MDWGEDPRGGSRGGGGNLGYNVGGPAAQLESQSHPASVVIVLKPTFTTASPRPSGGKDVVFMGLKDLSCQTLGVEG